MEYIQGKFEVIRILKNAMYDFIIYSPELAESAKPGQFVHVKVPGFMLRRPISICEINSAEKTIRILFDVRGDGTDELAKTKQGDLLDIMGPLGNGFELISKGKKAIVVGGGIGVPPLLEIAKYYNKNCTAILGFRDKSKAVLQEDFIKSKSKIMLATDDGSLGHHGFVTDLLRERLSDAEPVNIVYACGPKVMLKAVAECCAKIGVRCQVSLEERMACGVGACLGCACKTVTKEGKAEYSHVCKNGPVFEAERVLFDD